MSSSKEYVKNHPSSLRYISILGIIALIIPTFFIGEFAGDAGKYFALCVYLLIAILGSFEVLKNLNISWPIALLVALSTSMIFFFPKESFMIDTLENGGASDAGEFKNVLAATNFAISWKSILVIAFMPLLTLLDKKMWENPRKMLPHMLIASITLVWVSIFAKFIWVVNILDYTKLFYFIPIAIIADSFAYFGGKYLQKYFWNGKKLAPKISPKKTWAGFIIGYVASALFIGIVGWAIGAFADLTANEYVILVLLTIFLPIVATLGDLLFSAFKRYLGIKDFSNLMPGHGGIMDRLDAMSSVILIIFIVVAIVI